MARAIGFRSALGVPMLLDGQPIGAVNVTGAQPAMFTDRQIAMLQTFADQAVIAIENTRLFNELQTRTAELGRSVERAEGPRRGRQAQSARPSISTPCSRRSSPTPTSLQGRRQGRSLTTTKRTEELRPVRRSAIRRTSRRPCDAIRSDTEKVSLVERRGTRQPVQVPDIAAEGVYDSRFRNLITGERVSSPAGSAADPRGPGAGGLDMARNNLASFRRQVIDLLTTFASQSALAMQNARLFHQLEIASQHKSTVPRQHVARAAHPAQRHHRL